MPTSSLNSLCQSLDIRKEQPIVLQKELTPDYCISVRPVCIHSNDDINAIHEWLSDGSPASLPVDQLRVFFILLAECTYAQAFMVLLNEDTPIGQFEVYEVLQDELKDAVNAGEGDYRIYIPVMPMIASWPDITVQIMQICLRYFFSWAEVKRVFWVIPVNDSARIKVAIKAGFHLLKSFRQITTEGNQPANVYRCIRP
jgi:hypothetical protein